MSAEHLNASALKDSFSFEATYQLTDGYSLYPVSETLKYLKLLFRVTFFFFLSLENLVGEVLLLLIHHVVDNEAYKRSYAMF